jgi:hypothetical protein
MNTKTKLVLDLIVFLLMLLFIYAAVFKLLDFKSFRLNISTSFFGKSIAGTLALGIPILELLVATLLFFSRLRLLGLYSSLLLMLGFTAYIGYYVLFDAAQKPCACGGILNNLGWREHLVFNVIFTLFATIGIFLQNHKDRTEYSAPPSS